MSDRTTIIEHAYIEVTPGTEPIGFYRWSFEEQMRHYREALKDLSDQIKRHCDSDTPGIVLTTKEVCAHCNEDVPKDVNEEPWCCDKQIEVWEARTGASDES